MRITNTRRSASVAWPTVIIVVSRIAVQCVTLSDKMVLKGQVGHSELLSPQKVKPMNFILT